MKHSILKVGIVALALATIVACGKKGSDGASVNTAREQRAAGPSGLPTGQGGLAGTQGASIAFNESQKAQMRDAVQVLVSPTMDPEAVGDIRSVVVTANIGLQNNNMFTADSALQIVITDSYAGTPAEDGSNIEPITIRLRGNVMGSWNYNNMGTGTANVTFTDEYGAIRVQGTFSNGGQTFTGVLDFDNKTMVNGKKGGTLGQFTIQTCAFFRCQ